MTNKRKNTHRIWVGLSVVVGIGLCLHLGWQAQSWLSLYQELTGKKAQTEISDNKATRNDLPKSPLSKMTGDGSLGVASSPDHANEGLLQDARDIQADQSETHSNSQASDALHRTHPDFPEGYVNNSPEKSVVNSEYWQRHQSGVHANRPLELSDARRQHLQKLLNNNQRLDGLEHRVNEDGSVYIDLRGRFKQVVIVEPDGNGNHYYYELSEMP